MAQFVARLRPLPHFENMGVARHACPISSIRDSPIVSVIRVYDDVGNVIEAHEHAGEFKEL